MLMDDEDPLNKVGRVKWHFGRYIVLRFAGQFHHGRDMWVIERESSAKQSVKYDTTRPDVHRRPVVVGTLRGKENVQHFVEVLCTQGRTAIISGLA